jgi:hypothetical protein
VVTVLHDNLLEARRFKEQLRAAPIPNRLLWQRPKPNA